MTRQQLDLLIRYINMKAEMATKYAKGQGVPPGLADELVDLITELEETTE